MQRPKPQTESTFRDILAVYWDASRTHGYKIASILITGAIGSLGASVVAPLYYKKFINLLHDGGTSDLTPFIIVLATIALIGIGSLIVGLMNGRNIILLEIDVMSRLRRSAYERVLSQSYRFFSESFVGSLVNKINSLTKSFEPFADAMLSDVWMLLFSTIGVLFVVFRIDIIIGFAMLAWMLLILTGNYLFVRWRFPLIAKRSVLYSATTGALSDGITNALNVKVYTAQPYEIGRFKNIEQNLIDLQQRTWLSRSRMERVRRLLTISLEFLVMFLSLKRWIAGGLTIGDLVLFQSYIIGLQGKLTQSDRVIQNVFSSMADAKEAVDIINAPNEIRDKRGAKPLVVRRGAIMFRQAFFAYQHGQSILERFNVSITPKEKIALVGPSGAGKTTVTKLLLRFFDVNDGDVLIDNQSVSDVTQQSLHDAISFVPQEPVLFHRSLKENISYGRRDATDTEIIEAAKQAHCHEFISRLPEGYDTLVGERGIKLSGGERQRVAIARAILKDAPILVLDEATSSLDSESESLIQDALRVLMKNKTVIVIAHRLSTIMQMDRIIVMEDGKVTDMGTHDQLLKKTGVYRKLWNIQAGGFQER